MIKILLYENNNHVYRIHLEGHSNYAVHGKDIVCSAVSLLTLNTINAIESFTDEPFKMLAVDEKKGLIDIVFTKREQGEYEPEAELLIRTLILGLIGVRDMYGEKYIKIQKK